MPSNLTAETSEGDRYYTCGDYKQAIVSYTQLIDKNSHEKDTKIDQLDKEKLALVYNNRGHAKYMLVDFYAARDDYDEAIKLDPKLSVAYYNRATINYRMGDFAPALDDFMMSCKLDPTNLEYREGLSSCQECLKN